MLFNSLEFILFFIIVLLFYWQIRRLSIRNLFLLITSYIFYGWWDYRFLGLVVISSFSDYYIGLFMAKAKSQIGKKRLLWLSLIINLGILGFFKYYNFFIASFAVLCSQVDISPNFTTLNIILPVGISFYTFQTLSYTIDIYRGTLKPTENIVGFFAYVSFFPQLVAGPIERAANLLPQFDDIKKLDPFQFKEGLKQILWGLFKKVVIADQCAVVVDDIFLNYSSYSSPFLVLGAILFAFQIYCDFSGYSDIAIGVAKMLGFKLMRNFNYPYFSRDIAEFWRKWHISLSTWFRDYLYIPLGGSRVNSDLLLIRNVFIIFIVSGFWHGANWTFIVWGALNGLYFLPSILKKKNRKNMDMVASTSSFPSFKEAVDILITFTLVTFAWIFFRATDVTHAFAFISQMFYFDFQWVSSTMMLELGFVLISIILLITLEWTWRFKEYPFESYTQKKTLRWAYYFLIGTLIIINFESKETFIYFQF